MLDTVAFPLIEVILRVLFAMDCRFKTLRFPPYIPLLLNFSMKILKRKRQVQKEVEKLKATLAKV